MQKKPRSHSAILIVVTKTFFNSCHVSFFQLWVAYAPCGAQHKDAVQVTLEQIDLIKRMVESYPNQLELVRSADGEFIFIVNARAFIHKEVTTEN